MQRQGSENLPCIRRGFVEEIMKKTSMSHNKWQRYAILALCVFSRMIFESEPASAQPTHSPQPSVANQAQMLEEYYTGDQIPGEPSRGMSVLKRLYEFVQIYRNRHEGHFPNSGNGSNKSLLNDMIFNAKSYGFPRALELMQSFDNPDNQYDDKAYVRQKPEQYISCTFPHRRYDGSRIGDAKPNGTSDLLSYVSIYYHQNGPSRTGIRKSPNPVGFYLILWDNGSIERVAYDEVLYIPQDKGFSLGFRKQAGLPSGCITYEEFWTRIRHSVFPAIGYPVPDLEAEIIPDNGGYESLLWLSRLLDIPLEREQIWNALGRTEKEFTLDRIKAGAQKLGLTLQKQKFTIEELRKRHAPAILFLKDAGRIITLASLDEQHALIIDRGLTLMVETSTLAKRYSGEALISGPVGTSAALQADDSLREIEVHDPSVEITQSVTLTNHAQKALTLQVERPIPGVTQAKLEKETLAPGQSTQVSLKLKWRSVLPAREQTDLLTIQTDDAIAPRLQLAFKLKLADGLSTPVYTPDASSLPRAEDDPNNQIAVATPTVKVGQPAPGFVATDMNGKIWKLSDLKGKKNLLLTFFPKCFTGGCANHLSSLRDHQAEFDAANTQILAVSVDPAEGEKGQKAFAAQWRFTFPLLPDTKRELTRLYGATQDDKQLAARMSVLIDKAGIVRWIDTDVHVSTHGVDVLAKMRELGMAK
jgi:peroxiredoxin (alkyl hydroperoxide reductase subunit C)